MAEGYQCVRRKDTEGLLLPVVSSIISKEAWEDLQIRGANKYVSGKNTNLHVNVQFQSSSPLRRCFCRLVTEKSTFLLSSLHSRTRAPPLALSHSSAVLLPDLFHWTSKETKKSYEFSSRKKILRDGPKLFKGRFTFFTIPRYPLNSFHQPPVSGNYKSIHALLQPREQQSAGRALDWPESSATSAHRNLRKTKWMVNTSHVTQDTSRVTQDRPFSSWTFSFFQAYLHGGWGPNGVKKAPKCW